MLLAARALGLGAPLTTLYLQFEKEAEAALGLPRGVHSYAPLLIGYHPPNETVRASSPYVGRCRLRRSVGQPCSDRAGACCSDRRLFGSREDFTTPLTINLEDITAVLLYALDDKSSRGGGLFTGNVTIMRQPTK
jgi:hypothetical protein